jgi:DNA-repair protein complementing XP-A cells
MTLTEEQRERIRKNRERALQIQRERKLQQQQQQESASGGDEVKKRAAAVATTLTTTTTNDGRSSLSTTEWNRSQKKARRETPAQSSSDSDPKNHDRGDQENDDQNDDDLEPFEEGGSEWVTRREAMDVYCLPAGTLAVCYVEERDNPHNRLWKPMKLYRRTEVRRRARHRYGGREGLIEERTRRQQRKLTRDLEAAKDIFD